MKNQLKYLSLFIAQVLFLTLNYNNSFAQETTDSTATAQEATATTADDHNIPLYKPVKNTFEGVMLIDNQTVMVPMKGTLEFDIQHRFGVVTNGAKDLWGIFAPSNIRLGMNYAPIKNLFLGVGLTKERMQLDLNGKYGILYQTPHKMPVSVTYFANMVIDTRDRSNFRYSEYRYSYFHELIIARKVTDRFSLQIAPNLSWYNNVDGYVDSKGNIQPKMNNAHFAIATLARFKLTDRSSIIFCYDQPLTQHPTNNPHPNVAFGFETTTSAHSFQVFATNFYGIVPQSNNFFNQNDYTEGSYLIGFNITRLWNF